MNFRFLELSVMQKCSFKKLLALLLSLDFAGFVVQMEKEESAGIGILFSLDLHERTFSICVSQTLIHFQSRRFGLSLSLSFLRKSDGREDEMMVLCIISWLCLLVLCRLPSERRCFQDLLGMNKTQKVCLETNRQREKDGLSLSNFSLNISEGNSTKCSLVLRFPSTVITRREDKTFRLVLMTS
jgi:hypothetical protein